LSWDEVVKNISLFAEFLNGIVLFGIFSISLSQKKTGKDGSRWVKGRKVDGYRAGEVDQVEPVNDKDVKHIVV